MIDVSGVQEMQWGPPIFLTISVSEERAPDEKVLPVHGTFSLRIFNSIPLNHDLLLRLTSTRRGGQ